MPGSFRRTCGDLLACFFTFAREAAGSRRAPGIPCALNSRGPTMLGNLGHDHAAGRRTHAKQQRRRSGMRRRDKIAKLFCAEGAGPESIGPEQCRERSIPGAAWRLPRNDETRRNDKRMRTTVLRHYPPSEPEVLRSGSSSYGGGHTAQSKLRPKPGQTVPRLYAGATGRISSAAQARLRPGLTR